MLDGTLLNKNYPILYYWDGHGDLNEIMCDDENFKSYLSKINIYEHYLTSEIFYFYFVNEGENVDTEKYTEYNSTIQELLPFAKLRDKDKAKVVSRYVFPIFNHLYKNVFKTDYNVEMFNCVEDSINHVYREIKNKYQERFSLNTLLNYVREKMVNGDVLNEYVSNDTLNSIIKYLNTIIKE